MCVEVKRNNQTQAPCSPGSHLWAPLSHSPFWLFKRHPFWRDPGSDWKADFWVRWGVAGGESPRTGAWQLREQNCTDAPLPAPLCTPSPEAFTPVRCLHPEARQQLFTGSWAPLRGGERPSLTCPLDLDAQELLEGCGWITSSWCPLRIWYFFFFFFSKFYLFIIIPFFC